MGSDATDRVRHALLVEDEALVAMVAEEFLAELGFEPISARNAAEAMEIIESRRDLVVAVVDVGLPDQRGEIAHFTGVTSPYEAPENAELTVQTAATSAEQAAKVVLDELKRRGIV